MNLYWINHHSELPGELGGNRHLELAKRLAKTFGFHVTLVRGAYDHLPKKPLLDESITKNGFSILNYDDCDFLTIDCLPCKNRSHLTRIRNMISFANNTKRVLFREPIDKPDIVIGSTVHLFAASASLDVARHFNVPFVYEVRDLWPLTPIELGGYSRWHPFLVFLDYLDRKLARSADLVITTAPLMKEYYKERFGIPDEKFLWITNGTDLELFKNLPQVDEKVWKDSFDIFYAGAHGLANGLDQVFDQLPAVTRKHPQVHLTLVGDGPLKPRLEERAQKEGVPVHFLDAVSKNELPAILNKANALLVYLEPCRLYRYGISLNKLADYHAMGKPILFIGACAMNPVIQAGSGIVAEDIDHFPDALEEIITCGPEKRKEMGAKARAFAEEHYDWDKLAEKLAVRLAQIRARKV